MIVLYLTVSKVQEKKVSKDVCTKYHLYDKILNRMAQRYPKCS